MDKPGCRQVFAQASLLALAIGATGCLGGREAVPPDDGFALCTRPETGCACTPGRMTSCSLGSSEGYRECLDDGTWSACQAGSAVQRSALLNDNTPSTCGGCDASCWLFKTIPSSDADLLDPALQAEHLACLPPTVDDPCPGLTLSASTSSSGLHAYIASADYGYVSKVAMEAYTHPWYPWWNVRMGEEVARYQVGPPTGRCPERGGGCAQPSRTAVDAQGNGYVASRSYGGQAYITKIAGSWNACRDANGDRVIHSHPIFDPLIPGPPARETPRYCGLAYSGGKSADECVLWNRPVGTPDCVRCNHAPTGDCWDISTAAGENPDCANTTRCVAFNSQGRCTSSVATCDATNTCQRSGVPLGLAIDRRGRLWVGMFYDRGRPGKGRFYVLDPDTGAELANFPVEGQPFGAAIDGTGKLWYVHRCCARTWIQYLQIEDDPDPSVLVPSVTYGPIYNNLGTCNGSFGIVADTKGRVILGGWPDNCVSRFDPSKAVPVNTAAAWEMVEAGHNASGTLGVTLDIDDAMFTVSHNTNNMSGNDFAHKLPAGESVIDITTGRAKGPIGIASDFTNHMWTINYVSGSLSISYNDHRGMGDEAPVGGPDVWGNSVTYVPTADTYSDFTGFLRATVTAPEGSFVRTHDAYFTCGTTSPTFQPDPVWANLYWEAETPGDSIIELWARAGDTTTELANASEFLLAELFMQAEQEGIIDVNRVLLDQVPPLQYLQLLEVRVVLKAGTDGSKPIFRNMTLESYCTCECDTDPVSCTTGCLCDEQCY